MLRHGPSHGHGMTTEHNGELFEWLISLRFLPELARGYTAALVRLGFDDLQSLREVCVCVCLVSCLPIIKNLDLSNFQYYYCPVLRSISLYEVHTAVYQEVVVFSFFPPAGYRWCVLRSLRAGSRWWILFSYHACP